MRRTVAVRCSWLILGLAMAGLNAQAVQGSAASAEKVLRIAIVGEQPSYTAVLLDRVLSAAGYRLELDYLPIVPTTRLEFMMERGLVSLAILGRTAERDQRFLSIRVGMTDNLVGKRILFIRPGRQPDFDRIYSLQGL